MPALRLKEGKARTQQLINAVAAATAAPIDATFGFMNDDYSRVRFYFEYTAQVAAVAGTIWLRNRYTGHWGTWATISPVLAPGGASPVNEVRDAIIGQHNEFYLQLTTVTVTGGTVTVYAQGLVVEPVYN